MGMAGAVCIISSAYAVKVSNSFVTIEGEGVSVLDDGSISRDENALGDITVTARPGWLVNGQKTVKINPSSGIRQMLAAASQLGEDQEHIHYFPSTESDEHVFGSYMEISADANPASDIKMYALPDRSIVVTVSAKEKLVNRAFHRKVVKYGNCSCGEAHDPEVEYGTPYAVEPDQYEWTASGAGLSFRDSTWTGEMTKGLGQRIKFTVRGIRNKCEACGCTATAKSTVDVHELSIERPDYIGLDMTDAKRGEYIYKSATAKIDPAPAVAEYEWQKCGRCEFSGATDKASVKYGANDGTGPSGTYLEEELIVKATARNKDDMSAEANCTTNFTVVKVDESLGNWGELMDEKNGTIIGSFVKRDGMGLFGGYPDLAKNAMVQFPVCVEIFPAALPADERVSLQFVDNNLIVNNTPEVAKKSYTVNEIRGQHFYLFDESANVGVKCIDGVHDKSSAKDKIVYDVSCCTFTLYTDCSSDLVGHTFWKIDVDSAHKGKISEHLRKYIGVPYGFYPCGDGNKVDSLYDVIGILQSESGHYNNLLNKERGTASHVWHIPFEGCVKGLEQVNRIAEDKPNYDLMCFNCTDAALSVGLACGVPVPNVRLPDMSIMELIRSWFTDWDGNTFELPAFNGAYSSPLVLLVNMVVLNEKYGENE